MLTFRHQLCLIHTSILYNFHSKNMRSLPAFKDLKHRTSASCDAFYRDMKKKQDGRIEKISFSYKIQLIEGEKKGQN